MTYDPDPADSVPADAIPVDDRLIGRIEKYIKEQWEKRDVPLGCIQHPSDGIASIDPRGNGEPDVRAISTDFDGIHHGFLGIAIPTQISWDEEQEERWRKWIMEMKQDERFELVIAAYKLHAESVKLHLCRNILGHSVDEEPQIIVIPVPYQA